MYITYRSVARYSVRLILKHGHHGVVINDLYICTISIICWCKWVLILYWLIALTYVFLTAVSICQPHIHRYTILNMQNDWNVLDSYTQQSWHQKCGRGHLIFTNTYSCNNQVMAPNCWAISVIFVNTLTMLRLLTNKIPQTTPPSSTQLSLVGQHKVVALWNQQPCFSRTPTGLHQVESSIAH